jgi:hypothetical protein
MKLQKLIANLRRGCIPEPTDEQDTTSEYVFLIIYQAIVSLIRLQLQEFQSAILNKVLYPFVGDARVCSWRNLEL